MIDISKLNKAEVLAALYNNSKPQGLGMLHYNPDIMTKEKAAEILKKTEHFDYLLGRVMKVSLDTDELSVWGYDRDNGDGAAERALKDLKEVDSDTN